MKKIDAINNLDREELESYLKRYHEFGYLCEVTIGYEDSYGYRTYRYNLAVYKIDDE